MPSVKTKLLFLLFFICVASPWNILQASGPVSHAYLTYRFFEHFPKYTEEEKKAFMIGSLFADIRYLGEASRQKTHFDNITINDILKEKSPFMAGLKFHSWVDTVREEFVINYQMYHKLANLETANLFTFLKLAEDEVVFNTFDWQECCIWLKDIHPEELTWGMEEPTIRKWHNLVTFFFSNSPATALFMISATGGDFFNISSQEIAYWNKILKACAEGPTMQRYVFALNDHFESRLRDNRR